MNTVGGICSQGWPDGRRPVDGANEESVIDPVTIFTDPKAYTDPEGWHAVAARLRREDAVPHIEIDDFDPFWAVTRHADVILIERQPEHFPNTVESVLMPKSMKPSHGGPPVPGALRKTLEARTLQLAGKYVDRMAELGGRCDFAIDVARYYPLQVIMSVLGVPESDELRMLEPAEYTAATFVGAPKRVPIRYQFRG